jgi:hypothetical protein
LIVPGLDLAKQGIEQKFLGKSAIREGDFAGEIEKGMKAQREPWNPPFCY